MVANAQSKDFAHEGFDTTAGWRRAWSRGALDRPNEAALVFHPSLEGSNLRMHINALLSCNLHANYHTEPCTTNFQYASMPSDTPWACLIHLQIFCCFVVSPRTHHFPGRFR